MCSKESVFEKNKCISANQWHQFSVLCYCSVSTFNFEEFFFVGVSQKHWSLIKNITLNSSLNFLIELLSCFDKPSDFCLFVKIIWKHMSRRHFFFVTEPEVLLPHSAKFSTNFGRWSFFVNIVRIYSKIELREENCAEKVVFILFIFDVLRFVT